ncbi:MAG TPA: hypothetical protein VGN07_22555 [Steroidobacteraceae bacterium]
MSQEFAVVEERLTLATCRQTDPGAKRRTRITHSDFVHGYEIGVACEKKDAQNLGLKEVMSVRAIEFATAHAALLEISSRNHRDTGRYDPTSR